MHNRTFMIKWAGHRACMGVTGNLKLSFEDLSGKIILNVFQGMVGLYERLDGIHVAVNWHHWRTLKKSAVNLGVS